MQNEKKIIFFLISINILLYLIGFLFLEEHGASKLDSTLHTYPAIEGIRNNFLGNILTFGKYGEHSYPLHHIIFAFLNPFEIGSLGFRVTSTLWSFLILFFLFNIIKERLNFKSYEIIFFLSLLLLSPYFRSSAFWGMTENTGLLFLVLSIFYFNKLLSNQNLQNIFFVCLFSSLALYSRLQHLFICLNFFIYLIIFLPNKKKIYLILIYILFAIPALILIYQWGGFIDEQNAGELNSVINFKTIPRTILVVLSLIGFYSLPFLISLNSNYKYLIKKNFTKYFITLTFLVIIFHICKIDILSLDETRNYAYGQGFLANFFYKLTNIQETYLIFSALGGCVVLSIFNSMKNKILIICLIFVFSFRVHFFTEYLDPLLFILALSLLDLKKIGEIKRLKNMIIFQVFFISTLFGALLL